MTHHATATPNGASRAHRAAFEKLRDPLVCRWSQRGILAKKAIEPAICQELLDGIAGGQLAVDVAGLSWTSWDMIQNVRRADQAHSEATDATRTERGFHAARNGESAPMGVLFVKAAR